MNKLVLWLSDRRRTAMAVAMADGRCCKPPSQLFGRSTSSNLDPGPDPLRACSTEWPPSALNGRRDMKHAAPCRAPRAFSRRPRSKWTVAMQLCRLALLLLLPPRICSVNVLVVYTPDQNGQQLQLASAFSAGASDANQEVQVRLLPVSELPTTSATCEPNGRTRSRLARTSTMAARGPTFSPLSTRLT